MGRAVVRSLGRVAVTLALLGVAGCGPNLGTPSSVSGTVTVDGQPLEGGKVNFVRTQGPVEQRSAQGTTDASGQYKIEKIYPGTYQVNVLPAVMPNPEKESAEMPFSPPPGGRLEAKIGPEKATYDIKLIKTKKGR